MCFHCPGVIISAVVHLLQTMFSLFVFQLTFARFYLPVFIPEAEKAIYLDDDIIVQGKNTIKEEAILSRKPNDIFFSVYHFTHELFYCY